MRLQAASADELPICSVCTLEGVRALLDSMLEAPDSVISDTVKPAIAAAFRAVVGALVSERADMEQDEHEAH
jgi:hypothetical protein